MSRDLDTRVAPQRRCWRLHLAYRFLTGEFFETLTVETGIDVEDLVRQLARRRTVWRRIIHSEAWNGLVCAFAASGRRAT